MAVEGMVFLVVFASAGIGYFYAQKRARQSMSQRFADRDPLGIEQVCDLFCIEPYADRLMIKELLDHVAAELDVNPEVLRPSDRFEVELKPVKGWGFDSGVTTLMLELDRLAKEKNLSIDLSSVKTLADYVEWMLKVY